MAKSDEHDRIQAVLSRLAADLEVELAVGTKVTKDALTAAAQRFVSLGWADLDYITTDIGEDDPATPSADPTPAATAPAPEPVAPAKK